MRRPEPYSARDGAGTFFAPFPAGKGGCENAVVRQNGERKFR